MKSWINKNKPKIIVTLAIIMLGGLFWFVPRLFSETYEADDISRNKATEDIKKVENSYRATHIATPNPLKAIYMTSWIAGRKDLRERVLKIVRETEINAIVIDIKDDTGRISFEVNDPILKEIGSQELRIADLREFIAGLHKENIYVIGRVSSFQDPQMVRLHPEWAVKRKSDGGVWKDRKGLSWIDPGAEEMWQYLALIGRESFKAGFDEINYDYIRFPSDGDMNDITYPYSGVNGVFSKPEIIKKYFAYLVPKLKSKEFIGDKNNVPVVSADLFGMTTTASIGNDLNIGQIFENAIFYFDYVSPMVYPSHYPPHFEGYQNPNIVPYEIVKIAMDGAVSKIKALATTSPAYDYNKTRPWLQDFDYGGNYDVAEVQAQIKAVYDAGLSSWMIWDPSNRYTFGAYLPE